MSGFQEQLEKEIDKRGLKKVNAAERSVSQKNKNNFFSFVAFFKGFGICLLFMAALVGWASYKAEVTSKVMSEKLPSKTAIVERDNVNVYRLSESQPVLSMPSVDLNTNEDEQPDVETTSQEMGGVTPDVSKTPVQNNSKISLVSAPVPGLYENTTIGLLPTVRAQDNLTPFSAYKRPFQKTSDKPLLSIVFFNTGLSRQQTEGLIENFPPEVTFSMSPYAKDLKLLTDNARMKGHEVWLTLPLETKTYPLNDPGPLTLLVNASVEQNKGRLTSILASAQGYAGFVSQKDHAFKREDANVNPSIEEIFKRGLAILDSNPSLYSFVGDIAAKNDYPHAKNNFWLDEDLSPLALNQKIRQVIEYGKSGGNIVLMLRPYPASIKALQKFLNSAAADTFQLAPVSAQVQYGE